MATDLERLVVTLEAKLTSYEKALAKASGLTNKTADGIEKRFVAQSRKIEAEFTKTGGAIQAQTGNIAAQFQDIGVQLAGGQSPFLIALQQGTQLGAVLGQTGGGLTGAVKALGAGFAAVVSPVNLATIGLIALGGAAVQYFTSGDEGTSALTASLKEQDAVIRGLKEAYGEAAEGLGNYIKTSQAVADEKARQQIEQYRAAILSVAETARDQLLGKSFFSFSQSDFEGSINVLNDFRSAIADLEAGIESGEPDIIAFRREMAEIAGNTEASDSQREVARAIIEMTDEAESGQIALGNLLGTMGDLSAGSIAAAAQVKALGAAIKSLGGISLPNLSDETKAVEAYTEGLKNATTAGERASVEAAYIAAQQRIQTANTPKPGINPIRDLRSDRIEGVDPEPAKSSGGGRKGGGGGGRDRNEFEDTLKRIQERTEAYRLEAAAIQQFGGNVDQARTYVDLLMAAQEQGIPITDQLRASIAASAADYAAQSQAARDAAEATRTANDAAQEFSDLGRDLLGGFISDLRNGKSAAEALSGALDKVADKLLNMALDGLFGGKGGGGGIFGSLFGGLFGGGGSSLPNVITGGLYASGGYVSGPGTGRSDSIPARLSNGEYVINAKATKRNRALLDAINSGQKFADGGFVGANPRPAMRGAPAISGTPNTMGVNVTVVGARGNAEIEAMVQSGVAKGIGQYDQVLPFRIKDKQVKSKLRG